MKALLVGESWGEKELVHRHAFVGPTGVDLGLMLSQVNFAPPVRVWCKKCGRRVDFTRTYACAGCGSRVWPSEVEMIAHWERLRADHAIAVTNVFNHHPEHNELGHLFGTDKEVSIPGLIRWKPSKKVGGSYLKREYMPHLMRLWDEVMTLQPNVIVALGNAACWALLDQTKISVLRGTFTMSERLKVKVVPTFHPAAIMRQYTLRTTVLADLDKARRESAWPEIRRTERFFTVPHADERGIEEIREWMSRPAIAYASDIETHRGQISDVGFARSLDDALIIPFHDDNHSNYWPTERLEVEAWRLTIAGLKRPVRKIGQNYMYDLSYLMRQGIYPDLSAGMDDTMLWHHANYPEMQKSLGYQGSLYVDEIAWKPLAKANALKRDE